MGQSTKQHLTVDKLAENLALYAIDRTDLKELLDAIPTDNNLNLTKVEYELQILKILSAGWAVAFYLPVGDKNKKSIETGFWHYIREISNNISSLTESTTGHDIDYFDIIKTRLDQYVSALRSGAVETDEPSTVMGPEFARACDCEDDAIAILTGTKMFTLTLGAVKEYLDSVEITTETN